MTLIGITVVFVPCYYEVSNISFRCRLVAATSSSNDKRGNETLLRRRAAAQWYDYHLITFRFDYSVLRSVYLEKSTKSTRSTSGILWPFYAVFADLFFIFLTNVNNTKFSIAGSFLELNVQFKRIFVENIKRSQRRSKSYHLSFCNVSCLM